ncbi:DsrE family protein [Solidesulfovibrio sp. C21]|uniref:DsrE family protein n=1 Tax=Solidesulfovibrio sp. C21 TaxID=3398613 RepID=UPI0039FC4BD3
MRYDVVFHVDEDAAHLDAALTNIRNYYAALPQERFTAVLLVNGPAIKLMGADGAHAQALAEAAGLGLTVRVCRNALRHFGLAPEWLCPVCEIVPAGVVELVARQAEGYAYIKP